MENLEKSFLIRNNHVIGLPSAAKEIDDSRIGTETAWSSKKTNTELAQKLNANNNTSMVGLGFTKGDTVHVSDFLGALVAKFGRNGYCNMLYANASSATVVNSAGTQSVLINGGVLYFSATNEKFPNDTWSYAEAIYYPIEGVQGKMYKFFARTAGEAGTVGNSGIYQYSSDIEIINDTVSDSTSTYSSAKIDEKYGSLTFASEGSTQWLKLKLGTSSKFQPIVVSDQYGGKVEILGMANDGAYKPVKLVRHSYGDWTTHSATDYTTTADGDANYKIRRFFYYPTNGCYYLEIRQWAIIKVEGNSTAEMVASLPTETSAMTLIPESQFASKKDIDGTTIQTTTITGEEYYAITYSDDYNDPANQNILIQYKRSNFAPSTYILSAVSYATNTRETVSVAKISNNFAGSTYNLRFYVDKDNKTVYLRMPSYSSVSLQNLAFKSKAVTYTKVDSIPNTATALAVAEYATKEELKTSSNTDLTTVTFNSTYATATSGGHGCTYIVRNGICYVNMDMRIVANGKICTLPKPLMSVVNIPMTVFMHNITGEVEAVNNGILMVNSDGSATTLGALTNESRYMMNFSYPIA